MQLRRVGALERDVVHGAEDRRPIAEELAANSGLDAVQAWETLAKGSRMIHEMGLQFSF